MVNRRRTYAAGLAVTALLAGSGLVACGSVPTGGPTPATATTAAASPSASVTPASSSPSATSAAPSATASASSTPGATRSATKPPSSPPAPPAGSCQALAASMTRAERAGQLFMVAIPSSGLSSSTGRLLDRYHVGSVILLGNSTAGRARIARVTDDVRQAVDAPAKTRTLLAGDQEGGLVQRFQGPGFDRIPAARDQATLSDSTLRSRAGTWGRQLKGAGIDADLAPVADVVPSSIGNANQPIGALRRGYGPDADVVADKVRAFTAGMDDAGVLTSVKHFPGLGRVTGNTDYASRVVDSTTTRRDKDLAGFKAGVDAGADMVMVSSATYSRIDDSGPATFSATVIKGMIRGDLGFDGVVISDDMAGASLATYAADRRATRFISAGGDLAIMGNLDQTGAMIEGVRSKAADDPAFSKLVTAAAARVLAMKAKRGLASCNP